MRKATRELMKLQLNAIKWQKMLHFNAMPEQQTARQAGADLSYVQGKLRYATI